MRGGCSVGRLIGRVVVVQHHDDRAGLGSDQRGILPSRGLAVEIAHGAGIAPGQPAIEPVGMGGRAGVGDAAGDEPELAGPRLDRGGEAHGDAAGTVAGGMGASARGLAR